MSLISVSDSISYSEGQQLRYCGLGAKFEEVIIKGDPGEMKVRGLPYSHLIQVIDFFVVHCILCKRGEGRCSSKVSCA